MGEEWVNMVSVNDEMINNTTDKEFFNGIYKEALNSIEYVEQKSELLSVAKINTIENITDQEKDKDRQVYENLMNSGILNLQILVMAYTYHKYNAPIHSDFRDININMKLFEISSNRSVGSNDPLCSEYTKYYDDVVYLRANFHYGLIANIGIPVPRPPRNSWF